MSRDLDGGDLFGAAVGGYKGVRIIQETTNMGLRQDLSSQPVSELPLRELICVVRGAAVREAVGLMRRKGLGCVVVVDDDQRPLGKFTERILIKLLIQGDSALDDPVSQHMASVWKTVRLSDKIEKVMDAMQEKGLRFVVVVDDQGKACALTGQRGLMEYIADHFPRAVKVQAIGSRVAMDEREGA